MRSLFLTLMITTVLMGCSPTTPPADTSLLSTGATTASGVTLVESSLKAFTGEATTSGVVAEIVSYGGFSGYLASPENAPATTPAIVLIHEWWGLNNHIQETARQLASEGYRVLAVDLYDGKVATNPTDARALSSGIDTARATAHLLAATEYVRSLGSEKVASWGWCFGGKQSLALAMASTGKALDATVIYYGSLTTDPAALSGITWPVLGIFGSTDASISLESVSAFSGALTANGTPNDIRVYEGVGHAFANPSNANYAPEETADAWKRTLTFLAETLRN